MYINLIEMSYPWKLTSGIRCSDMLGLGQKSYAYCPPGGDTLYFVKEHNHYKLCLYLHLYHINYLIVQY